MCAHMYFLDVLVFMFINCSKVTNYSFKVMHLGRSTQEEKTQDWGHKSCHEKITDHDLKLPKFDSNNLWQVWTGGSTSTYY